MKKRMMIVVALVLLSVTAYADYINPNRPYNNGGLGSLQGVLDVTFGNNAFDVVADQSAQALWMPAEAAVDSYLVTLMDTSTDYYGIYSAATGSLFQFGAGSQASFTINDSGDLWSDGIMQIAGFGHTFGFWVQNDYGNIYYSEDSLNNGAAHVLSYNVADGMSAYLPLYSGGTTVSADGDNDWVIAFESCESWANTGSGIGDFDDVVLYVEDISPVPEPATLLLLGSGLVGLAFLKRRKA